MSPDRYCSRCNTTHAPDESCPVTPTSLMSSIREKNPFNSPRDPALPPYHLRNSISERAEIDRHEQEHRRRLGMSKGRPEFEAWLTSNYQPPELTDNIIDLMWQAWQGAQR